MVGTRIHRACAISVVIDSAATVFALLRWSMTPMTTVTSVKWYNSVFIPKIRRIVTWCARSAGDPESQVQSVGWLISNNPAAVPMYDLLILLSWKVGWCRHGRNATVSFGWSRKRVFRVAHTYVTSAVVGRTYTVVTYLCNMRYDRPCKTLAFIWVRREYFYRPAHRHTHGQTRD